MQVISILGAGLSATDLIDYLIDRAEENNWKIRIGDFDLATAKRKARNHSHAAAFLFDVMSEADVEVAVKQSDIVVSMLPARFHSIIAKRCVEMKKHMLTASYVSKDMQALDEEAKKAGVILLNELGVDPGIDHMSAMKVIHKLQNEGAELLGFYSSTGGLVAPESDNNPWNYKFTWNPRNVVLAGQGVSMFIRNGLLKFIPYHKLYERATKLEIEGYGKFEMYPNRDSLSYRQTYGLEKIQTILRGTIRRDGYCKAWNVFVQLGATDDTYTIENSEHLTYRQFINLFLKFDEKLTVEEKLRAYLPFVDEVVMSKLEWLGIFGDTKVGLKNATPAQILQKILEEKWGLDPQDKDMIVMQHQFEYKTKTAENKKIISSMVMIGKDTVHTAMSMTVGLPLAIAVKMVATKTFTKAGVHIPVTPDLYLPILEELKDFGIDFTEEEFNL